MPPRRTGSGLEGSIFSMICLPPLGFAPSEAQMMVKRLPRWERWMQVLVRMSRSNGISGMRMMSEPEATPAWRASQPAFRPMTSTTMTRWCEAAVVWTRSRASVATATADWKPKVMSEPQRSLSIVLGTPMQLMPRSANGFAADIVPSPPTTMSASRPWS
jgi:hypothetical protein